MTAAEVDADTALDYAVWGDSGAEPLLMICGTAQARLVPWIGDGPGTRPRPPRPGRRARVVRDLDHVDAYQRSVIAGLRIGWAAGRRIEAITALGIAFTPEMVNSDGYAPMIEKATGTFPVTDDQIRTTVEQWDADLAHDTRDRLGSVTATTLVVAAERDLLTPVWKGRAIAAAIPGAQLHVFSGPGASHSVAFERMPEFVRLVITFLRAHLIARGDRPSASSRRANASDQVS